MEKSDRLIQVVILTLVVCTWFNLVTHSADCQAQSTQEINRQQHQQEVMKQQQQILQQQYIQTQQLEQMRRDAEFKFNINQSNRTHDHLHLHQPIRY